MARWQFWEGVAALGASDHAIAVLLSGASTLQGSTAVPLQWSGCPILVGVASVQ